MRSNYRRLLRSRIVVNLLSGKAIEGVLYENGGRLLTLRDASLLEAGREATPIDGEAWVHLDQIEFVQKDKL